MVGERRFSAVYDFAVIGGGIVGLSTARVLLNRYPDAGVLVLEKEPDWTRNKTGHNSGVIHSGIYYKPGSLKARFCKEGAERLVELCREYGISYEICGKVIVATEPRVMPRLRNLYERGVENGLAVKEIGPGELKELEPHAAGIAALKVPSTGIVDFVGVAKNLAKMVAEKGGELRAGAEVTDISESGDGVELRAAGKRFRARALINCAGLQSDRVAALGGVEAGPNAVLGLAREVYKRTGVRLKDLAEVLSYPAFWRLAGKNWKTGAGEVFRSLSKSAFVRGLRRLVPEVKEEDLVPTEAGVRAQALKKDGTLVDDFLIVEGGRSVH